MLHCVQLYVTIRYNMLQINRRQDIIEDIKFVNGKLLRTNCHEVRSVN
jgi:hypothetical protein